MIQMLPIKKRTPIDTQQEGTKEREREREKDGEREVTHEG